MPGRASDPTPPAGQSFREAIANWRLALRTEVKKSSALPTAMFDACDPMLETRLAETAEAMLACLQEPDPALADQNTPGGEQRLEVIQAAELRCLPRQIAAVEPGALDLQSGLPAEYLAILADACCTSTGPQQQHAVRRLCQDFAVTPDSDLDALTQLLAEQAGVAAAPEAHAASELDLATTCRRVAAAVLLHSLPKPAAAPTRSTP